MVIIICLIVGLVAALCITGSMKSDLQSVRYQNSAGNYVEEGSFVVHHQQDLFLYKNVTRRKKTENNSRGNS